MPTAPAEPAAQTPRRVSPQGVRGWLRWGLPRLAVVLVVWAIGGVVLEAAAERRDARAYPPPGQMVDVGGRRVHMLATGPNGGGPTVLLEAGVASFSSNWVRVQEALAATTRVVSWDRAGLGWSDRAPTTQDAGQSAEDLHAALAVAGIPPPYVVVGHSYGGLVVRAFQARYPAEVAGMVLVDASHPDQWAAAPFPGGSRLAAVGNGLLAGLAHVGLVRALGMDKSLGEGMPPRQAAELEASLARPGPWSTSAHVLWIWDGRTRPLIHQASSLGDLPLAVVSAPSRPEGAKVGGYAALLDQQQASLGDLSTNSLRVVVDGATHESLLGDEGHAAAVSDTILKVVHAVQTKQPLASD